MILFLMIRIMHVLCAGSDCVDCEMENKGILFIVIYLFETCHVDSGDNDDMASTGDNLVVGRISILALHFARIR